MTEPLRLLCGVEGVAEGSGVPALRRHGSDRRAEGQEHRPWRSQVLRLPQAVYREGLDRLRGQPHCDVSVVAGDDLDCGGSKQGISSNQLQCVLDITFKTALFMSNRIRFAMGGKADSSMGEGGGMVEVDKTYISRKPGVKMGRGGATRNGICACRAR